MTEHDRPDTATDGGVASDAARREQDVDYLETEINLLNPGTPYMRDHLRIILTGFVVWAFTTFGPITATKIAPGTMTTQMPVLGFPFHYFAIAIGGPSAALILSAWYARKRDQLDAKYGIDHSRPADIPASGEPVATDGGDDG